MSNENGCNDYWCDDYGKNSEKCDRCVKKESVKDKPDLRVILKRRADRLMELDKNSSKGQREERRRR